MSDKLPPAENIWMHGVSIVAMTKLLLSKISLESILSKSQPRQMLAHVNVITCQPIDYKFI